MGSSSTKESTRKIIERVCTSSINAPMIHSIVEEWDREYKGSYGKEYKEDKCCLQYCYRLVEKTKGEIWKNAKLKIVGNSIHVEIKAGKCETTVLVSLDHTGKPWHTPQNLPFPERKTEEDEDKKDSQADKKMGDEEPKEASETSRKTEDDEPKNAMETNRKSEDDESKEATETDRNEDEKKAEQTERFLDEVIVSKDGKEFALISKDPISIRSVNKIEAKRESNKFDVALMKCLDYAKTIIRDQKKMMSHVEINIFCNGKTVTMKSGERSKRCVIDIGWHNDKGPFDMREPAFDNGKGSTSGDIVSTTRAHCNNEDNVTR